MITPYFHFEGGCNFEAWNLDEIIYGNTLEKFQPFFFQAEKKTKKQNYRIFV